MKRQTFSKELLQIDQQTEGHRKIKKKEGKLGKKIMDLNACSIYHVINHKPIMSNDLSLLFQYTTKK